MIQLPVINSQQNISLGEILALVQKPPPIQVAMTKQQENVNFSNNEIVSISDICEKIQFLNQQSIFFLKQQNVKEFFINLRKNQFLIDVCLQQEIQLDLDQIVCNLINLSVFYAKIGLLEESKQTLEKCLQQIRKNKFLVKLQNDKFLIKKENMNMFLHNLKIDNLELKIILQICINLSEMDKHEEAYDYTQQSIKLCNKMLVNKLILCYSIAYSLKSTKIKNNLSDGSKKNIKIYRIFPILYDLLNKLKELHQSIDVKQFSILKDIQKSFGQFTLEQADISFIFNNQQAKGQQLLKSNIINLLKLNYNNLIELQQENSIENELSEDNIFLMISNMSISFYSAYIETRFILQKNNINCNTNFNESDSMLSRSLCIAYTYLPHNIPFVNQIISIFKKANGVTQQCIPEQDEKEKKNNKMQSFQLKPIQGIQKSDQFIPLVRFPKNLEQQNLLSDIIKKNANNENNQENMKKSQIDQIYFSYNNQQNCQVIEKSKSQDTLKNLRESPHKQQESFISKQIQNYVQQNSNSTSFNSDRKSIQNTPQMSNRNLKINYNLEKIQLVEHQLEKLKNSCEKNHNIQKNKKQNNIGKLFKIYQNNDSIKKVQTLSNQDVISDKESDRQSKAASESKNQQMNSPLKYQKTKNIFINNNINIIINNQQNKQNVKDILNSIQIQDKQL